MVKFEDLKVDSPVYFVTDDFEHEIKAYVGRVKKSIKNGNVYLKIKIDTETVNKLGRIAQDKLVPKNKSRACVSYDYRGGTLEMLSDSEEVENIFKENIEKAEGKVKSMKMSLEEFKKEEGIN